MCSEHRRARHSKGLFLGSGRPAAQGFLETWACPTCSRGALLSWLYEKSCFDNTHASPWPLCCCHKMPGKQSFPNSRLLTGPIHCLFVDTVWLVFYQHSPCAGSPGALCFIFLWQRFFHSCPHCKSLASRQASAKWPSEHCVVWPLSAVCPWGTSHFN